MKKTKRKVILFVVMIVAIIATIISAYILMCSMNSKADITTDIASLSEEEQIKASVSLNRSGYGFQSYYMGNFTVNGNLYDGYCMAYGKGIPNGVTSKGSAYIWYKSSIYNKLKWFFDNMVVVFQPIDDSVYKDDLANEITMYKKNINLLINEYEYSGNVDSLTEKQLFEVQQMIIWNNIQGAGLSVSGFSTNQLAMYNALIDGMNNNSSYTSDGTDIVSVTKETGFSVSADGKIGPFKLNNSKGKINRILVENFSGIDGGYTIIDSNGNKIEEYNKYNGTFYIKLNKTLSNGTKYNIKGTVSVKSYKTGVTMYWDNNNGKQPITTYSRDPEKSYVSFDSNYFSGNVDLALKKQITQVNGANVDSNVRSFNISATNLLNNTSTDATYNMRKTPVDVEVGDVVKYKIQIFNESKELDGYAKEITDYIPEGLKFDPSSSTNASNNWRLYKSNGIEAKWSTNTTLEFIANLYKQVLKRSQTVEQLKKDEGVLGHWSKYAAGTNTIETTISNIINSTEGKQKTDSFNDTQFVTLMYQVIFGRDPDSGGLATHTSYLNGDKTKRPQLVKNLLNSPEFRKIKYSKLPDSELDTVAYITTDILSEQKISKLTDAASLSSNSKQVEVELIVKDDATGILTNIAEITKYGYMSGTTFVEANKANIDRDSVQDNVTVPSTKSNLESYWGKDAKQKTEPANYPGQQDDDDFEKVKVDKTVDLALKKAIIQVGDTEYERLGEIDVSPLKNGNTTANYHMDKTRVYAKQGEIVTYRIYIFNEGTVNATASEIRDYLPSELEFLPDDEINKKYDWRSSTDSSTKITTLTTNYLQGNFIDRYTKSMKESRSRS